MKIIFIVIMIAINSPSFTRTDSLKIFTFKDSFINLNFSYPDSFSTMSGLQDDNSSSIQYFTTVLWSNGGSLINDSIYKPPENGIYIDVFVSSDNFNTAAADQNFILSDSTWYDRDMFEKKIQSSSSENIQLVGWNGVKVNAEWDLSVVVRKSGEVINKFVQKGFRYIISKKFDNKYIYLSADQRNAPDIISVLETVCKSITYNEKPLTNNGNKIYNNIREVDFGNFAYPYYDDIIIVKDSIYFAEIGDDYPSEYIYEIYNVIYGELTGDSEDEAIISTMEHTTGTTGWFSGGFIYSLINGKPKMIYKIESGDRAAGGVVEISVQEELLSIARANGLLGMCCPEYTITTKYKWNINDFTEKSCEGQFEFYKNQNLKDTLNKNIISEGIVLTDSVENDIYYGLELVKGKKIIMDVISSSKKQGMFLVLTDDRGRILNDCDDLRNNNIELIIPKNGFYTLRIVNDSVWKQQYKLTLQIL